MDDGGVTARGMGRVRGRGRPWALLTAGGLLLAAMAGCAEGSGSAAPAPVPLRMNQVQVIGSHNSYHIAHSPQTLKDLANAVKTLNLDVGDPMTLAYTHAPLDTQLDRGVRSFELDIGTPAPDARGVLTAVVEHIPQIDPKSTCPDLAACLKIIGTWSDAHPDHVPIPILLEIKGELTTEQMDTVDQVITSAVDPEDLITPDEVRGDAPTLKEAVTTTGWPEVDSVRGRLYFLLDNGGGVSENYREGHPNLEGRAIFTTDGLGEDGSLRDDAAALKLNDPGDGSQISDLVERGFVIRTRADAELVEAQKNETSRRETAFASGAQVVSTDFPPGEPEATTGYVVEFTDGDPGVRCNPVAAATGCTDPEPDR